ncbi:MAG: hypothetical protein KIT18_17030 [Burkholderiales bacterium]|nr:hypothetical protein [Burkholderiales bacterium]
MPTCRLAAAALAALVLSAAGACADDQTIQSNLTLSGFNNSSITAAFKTTDVFDSIHSCSPGSSSSCTAQNSYGSPPKNVGNILCLPNNLVYSITSGCQAILTSGEGQDCKGNPIKGFCGGNANVTASCAWRTNNNKNTVQWNWRLSYGTNGAITVDCSNSNYQGYTL